MLPCVFCDKIADSLLQAAQERDQSLLLWMPGSKERAVQSPPLREPQLRDRG